MASATTWASESNAEVCSTVLARGVAFVESNDLSGAYTTTASPVVRLQIAKQGYRYVCSVVSEQLRGNKELRVTDRLIDRLAKWLDAIVAAA